MIVYRPDPLLVDMFVDIDSYKVPSIKEIKRFKHKHDWYKNHRSFVLQELLPSIRPPKDVWRACAEAYLTDVKYEHGPYNCPYIDNIVVYPDRLYSYEQVLSDGSSLVPDIAYKWGKIKDPWAVAHDLLYLLHDHDLADVFGKVWNRRQCDSMYRRGWYSQDSYIIGSVWWFGLRVGGWVPWMLKDKCLLECKLFENNHIPLCTSCKQRFYNGTYTPLTICPDCLNLWDNGKI